MVCYIYDCNHIKVDHMKSRYASEWVKAYDSIHQELTVKGFKTKLQTLDNEASTALKNFFTVNDIAYRRGTRHRYFQGTLCGRALIS
jgi:virulence-associated protein VapD